MKTQKFRSVLARQLILLGVFFLVMLAVANSQVQANEPGCIDDVEGGFSQLCDDDIVNELLFDDQTLTIANAVNLLANSSFEDGIYAPENAPDYWSRGTSWPLNTLAWVDDQAYSGDKSIQIIGDDLHDNYWQQTVTVQPYTHYELSGWIKTENVVHGGEPEIAGANLSIYGRWSRTPALLGTNDWTHVSMVFNSGDDTEVVVAARLGYWAGRATGTAWFDGLKLEETTVTYEVVPILFVPNDLTPFPWGLEHVNKQMQMVQRWYAEQLRGKTFTFEPAQLVVGSYPLAHYYGDCYPPRAGCDQRYEIWNSVFADLANQGYPGRVDRIWGVFFQGDYLIGTNLGGGNRFIRPITPKSMFGDCDDPGCVFSVGTGATAHEFGHALGLPHTASDPEGSPGKSIMEYGFYSYPRVTIVDTITNPERTHLYASPFINVTLPLVDGGFEECLSNWTVTLDLPTCSESERYSGLSALQLTPTGTYYLKQEMEVDENQIYDISGWVNVVSSVNQVRVRLQALSVTEDVLSTAVIGTFSEATDGWERFGGSMAMPEDTVIARLAIYAEGLSGNVFVDGIEMRPVTAVPPAPLPMFHRDGDTIPITQPTLQWADVSQATGYQIQVAKDSSFTSTIVSEHIKNTHFSVPIHLTENMIYYWRVRAINGVGVGAWSPTWRFIPRSSENYFDDEFVNETLSTRWSWVRESSSHWHFGSRAGIGKGEHLGIVLQTGDLAENNDVQNILLQPKPPGDFSIRTIADLTSLNSNYQQTGLIIYQDDDNYIQLVRIYNDGPSLQFLAEVDGIIIERTRTINNHMLPIRIEFSGDSYRGFYSTNGLDWLQLGQAVSVNWPEAKVGLTAYNPLSETSSTTAYFDWFRVGCSQEILDEGGNDWLCGSEDPVYTIFLPVILKGDGK